LACLGDLQHLLTLSGFLMYHGKDFVVSFPDSIGVVSRQPLVARLPFFRLFYVYSFRNRQTSFTAAGPASVSVVIPCKNECREYTDAVERLPALGSKTEIIFCDDQSTDGTAEKSQKTWPEVSEQKNTSRHWPRNLQSGKCLGGIRCGRGRLSS